MASFSIPPPAPLNLDVSNPAASFKRFKQAFDNFQLATGVTTQSDAVRVATLLAVIGEPAVEVYNTFKWSDDTDSKKLDTVIKKFDDHFKGHINTTYERYVFNTRSQHDGETFD